MKNKYYNIFLTSEKDGRGKSFRLSKFSLFMATCLMMATVIFAYIGFSYVIGQDKMTYELRELREYKIAMENLLIKNGVNKDLVNAGNLEEIIMDYIMANNMIHPEEAPVDGYVTRGILKNDSKSYNKF